MLSSGCQLDESAGIYLQLQCCLVKSQSPIADGRRYRNIREHGMEYVARVLGRLSFHWGEKCIETGKRHFSSRITYLTTPGTKLKALGIAVHIDFGMRHYGGQSAVGCG